MLLNCYSGKIRRRVARNSNKSDDNDSECGANYDAGSGDYGGDDGGDGGGDWFLANFSIFLFCIIAIPFSGICYLFIFFYIIK